MATAQECHAREGHTISRDGLRLYLRQRRVDLAGHDYWAVDLPSELDVAGRLLGLGRSPAVGMEVPPVTEDHVTGLAAGPPRGRHRNTRRATDVRLISACCKLPTSSSGRKAAQDRVQASQHPGHNRPPRTTANTLALHCYLYLTALVEGGSRWRDHHPCRQRAPARRDHAVVHPDQTWLR
jgi:hypothetical protein